MGTNEYCYGNGSRATFKKYYIPLIPLIFHLLTAFIHELRDDIKKSLVFDLWKDEFFVYLIGSRFGKLSNLMVVNDCYYNSRKKEITRNFFAE